MPVEQFRAAIVGRISSLFDVPINEGEVDYGAQFIEDNGFVVGDSSFDSIDLVEVLVTLEEELGVSLLDGSDDLSSMSIGEFARYLDGNVAQSTQQEFILANLHHGPT